MITDLAELRVRLQVLFELLDHEYNVDDARAAHPFPYAVLAALDLIEEIQRSLARDERIKLDAVVRAWQQRSVDGRPAPKAVS